MLTAKNSHTFQVWHLTQNFQDPFIYQILRLHFTVPSQSMPKPLGPCQEGDGLLNFDEFSLLVSGLNADGAEGPAGARHGAPLVSELPRLIMAYHGSSWNSDVFFSPSNLRGTLFSGKSCIVTDLGGGAEKDDWWDLGFPYETRQSERGKPSWNWGILMHFVCLKSILVSQDLTKVAQLLPFCHLLPVCSGIVLWSRGPNLWCQWTHSFCHSEVLSLHIPNIVIPE